MSEGGVKLHSVRDAHKVVIVERYGVRDVGGYIHKNEAGSFQAFDATGVPLFELQGPCKFIEDAIEMIRNAYAYDSDTAALRERDKRAVHGSCSTPPEREERRPVRISRVYQGTGHYFIRVNGHQVFVSTDQRAADMFEAELLLIAASRGIEVE